MRTIKFRIWNKEQKNMWTWERLLDKQCTYLNSKYFVVMQFTGLHDGTKWEDLTEVERENWTRDGNMPSEWNGKEIYEGDIVIWKQALGGILQADSDPKTCVIEWDEFFSSWKCRDINKEDHFRGYTFHECHMESVIGNIYENPELLNEK